MKKCVIICNPNSGKKLKSKDLMFNFLQILPNYGYEPIFRYTRYAGHAKEIVKNLEDDTDLVISIGGDGTFNEIMTGNLERKNRLILSHIPYGTANDLGAMYGMGKNPVNNLKMILEGEVKKVDVCKINNHPFVYVAGLGKFVNVAYDTPRELKKRFGYLAYAVNAIKAFQRKTKLFEMEIKANGETYHGLYSFILVSNATRMGGINFFNNVKLDDGKFEVIMTNITSKKDIVKSFYILTTNGPGTKVPGFYFIRTDHLNIKLKEKPKKEWTIDGEILKDKSLEYDITLEKGIKMLVPKKNISKIFEN